MKIPKLSDIITAKDSSQVSLDDLRQQVSALAKQDARFTKKPENSDGKFCSEPWCDNILFDEGSFSAVIYTCESKLLEIEFTVKNGQVKSFKGEPQEVKRKTEYVAASEPFKFNGESVKDDSGEVVKSVGIPTPQNEDAADEVLSCKDAGAPIPTEKKWEFGKPARLMWAPGGTNQITAGGQLPSGEKRAVRIFVTADKNSAFNCQEDLEAKLASTPRRPPFGCIEHHEEEKAFEMADEKKKFTAKFEWSEKPEPAIYCTVLPTKLGETNVNGHLHTSFSPSFRHDAKILTAKCEDCDENAIDCACGGTLYFPDGIRGSESNPAKITGIGRKSVGSLTNWPAFKDILPITAKEPTREPATKAADAEENAKKTKHADKAKEAATSAYHSMNHAELEPKAAKEHATEASEHAEKATGHAADAKSHEKPHAHHWAAKAHEHAASAQSRNVSWQQESHHRAQAELHRRYAVASKDEAHPEHSRAMNFKASEPENKKNIFDGVKIVSSSKKSIYDGVVVNGQPAGRK